MAPFDKHHREYRATTESPASDWVCDDVLLPEGEPEAELPYYVEVAGDYSIPHATADHWGSAKALDDKSVRHPSSARPALRRQRS